MKLIRQGFCLIIKAYQRLIKPVLPPSCRFHPSCSDYALQCILKHGIGRGGYFAVRRLLCCQPFCAGGEDPVP